MGSDQVQQVAGPQLSQLEAGALINAHKVGGPLGMAGCQWCIECPQGGVGRTRSGLSLLISLPPAYICTHTVKSIMGFALQDYKMTKKKKMSHNTLDRADSSRAVHVTTRTRHRLYAAPGHLGPVPHAWNLSPRFISLLGPLPYVHFLSHLCLYVTYLFMI